MKRADKKKYLDVLTYYGMTEDDLSSLEERKKGKVWFIRDKKNRRFVLKYLPFSKTPFPILLQQRLHKKMRNKRVIVPKVVSTTSGEPFVEYKDGFYFLSEFIKDLSFLSKNERIKALAKLHLHAHFDDLASYNHKVRFPDQDEFLKDYKKKIDEIKKWRTFASSLELKKKNSEMIAQGEESFKRLKRCNAESYLRKTASRYSICHGDFHSRNVYATKNGKILIIDFDRAYYGPPLYDFRFLMMSLTRTPKPEQKLKRLFQRYFMYFEEDKKYRRLYLADTMFPHEFYKQVKKLLEKEKVKKLDAYRTKLFQVAQREKRKEQFVEKEWNRR